MYPRTPKALLSLILLVGASLAVSCGVGGGGGGGGEGGTNYPGSESDFLVERDSLDTGDITQVRLMVSDINRNGAILKFRLSKSLKYMRNSAQAISGDAENYRLVTPSEASDSDGRYLAFFIRRPPEDEKNYYYVAFNVKAVSGDSQAFIEVDLDNNDPNTPDSREFSSTNPQFSSIDRWNIDIAGAGGATPTPTASGTPTAKGTATPTK